MLGAAAAAAASRVEASTTACRAAAFSGEPAAAAAKMAAEEEEEEEREEGEGGRHATSLTFATVPQAPLSSWRAKGVAEGTVVTLELVAVAAAAAAVGGGGATPVSLEVKCAREVYSVSMEGARGRVGRVVEGWAKAAGRG